MSESPTESSTESSTEASIERVPQGSVAEPEVPQHTTDPDGAADSTGTPLEDTTAYELAVEDGAPLPATGDDPGAGDLAPELREPGA